MSRDELATRARAERSAGNLDAAIVLFEQALAGFGADDVARSEPIALEFVELACECGVLCKVSGDLGSARKLYTAAWAVLQVRGLTDGPLAAAVLHNLGALMHALGRPADAEPFARRAVEVRGQRLGHDHVDTLADRAARAAILIDLGELDTAEAELTRCFDRFTSSGAGEGYGVAAVLHNLATIAGRRGDAAGAAAMLERAVEIKQRMFGAHDPRLLVSQANLTKVRDLLGAGPTRRPCDPP